MVRGDPVCRLKEDCSQYDIGLVFKEISSYSDQDKLKSPFCMELAEKISLANIL